MYKVEFHVHTISSKDSILNKYFLYLMAKFKKINCFAITDHNSIDYAVKNKSFFERKGIDIIVGEEIFTKDGEIIGLFLKKKIDANLSAEETVKEIKKQNGLIYIPHPYDTKRYKTVLSEKALEEIKDDIDLIEVHNGRNISLEFSKRQNEIAEKYNLRKVVGSDAHTFYEIGRNYCILESISKENLLNSIENCTLVSKKCVKIVHENTKFVRVFKLLLGGDFHELCRIIKRKISRRK